MVSFPISRACCRSARYARLSCVDKCAGLLQANHENSYSTRHYSKRLSLTFGSTHYNQNFLVCKVTRLAVTVEDYVTNESYNDAKHVTQQGHRRDRPTASQLEDLQEREWDGSGCRLRYLLCKNEWPNCVHMVLRRPWQLARRHIRTPV